MMCFDNTVLCFDNSLLCSDNTMLCLEKCLLCLQIWATVLICSFLQMYTLLKTPSKSLL